MPLAPQDYADADDNVLFRAIKQSQWDHTRRILDGQQQQPQQGIDDDAEDAKTLASSVDGYGNTPLHAALGYGAPDDVLLRLLRSHPDATRVHGTEDWTPLHVASMWGCSPAVMRALIRRYPDALDDVGAGGIKGRTPRHFAGRFPATRALLERSTREWKDDDAPMMETERERTTDEA